ncbi:MarR family transcriptional regulator [Gordonia shandongensis]|uniref:MarR family transcriptional regulator n=1 Tax=Gordonia shandongensis TaxID=376351 RepID=UPI00047D9F68|nr:MarR family transcriptional regulator [Gordonia shandongensis]
MVDADPPTVSLDEIVAFENATRDLVGLALRSVEDLDMSLPQVRLLLVLDDLGPSPSTRCADALGVVGSTVTRLADRLVDTGHLTRAADHDNRSVVVLRLTEAGRDVVRSVTDRRRRELRRALDTLDPDLRAACAAALRALHDPLVRDESARRHLPL